MASYCHCVNQCPVCGQCCAVGCEHRGGGGTTFTSNVTIVTTPVIRRLPKPGIGYRWYSICSSHIEYDVSCPSCNMGEWRFEPRAKLERLVFRVSPKAWQRLAR